jgi:hypothetical protein
LNDAGSDFTQVQVVLCCGRHGSMSTTNAWDS